LIKALRILPEECRLYVASGSNPGAYRKRASGLGLEERVHFLGRVDDMPAFYQALDVYVQPTFCDACSNAVLEAAASGLPAVSSRFDGAAFFLPAENILNDPSDSASIAESIRRHISAPEASGIEKAQRFAVWPEAVPAGMEPWVELIEKHLGEKESPAESAGGIDCRRKTPQAGI
jgi:UDP-glucose:(heptosyl)LPS alpha-1,3-glucosyltransferase